MKKTLFTILICGLYSVRVQAQCHDFYVKTSNNSNIKVCTSGGYSLSQVQSADAYSRTFAISSGHVYEAGTNSYNCHGYAWHVKEGGDKVWINNVGYEYNNLNAYWTDGSYFVYNYNSQPHVENLKVFYGNADHTAVTTSNSNIFISKMGCGALVAHYKDNSPYTEGNFTYYIKAPPITAPDHLCGSDITTCQLNLPPGMTVEWESSNHLVLSSTTTNPVTVTRNTSLASGNVYAGWIKAHIKNQQGTPVATITKEISAGTAPLAANISSYYDGYGRAYGTCEFQDMLTYHAQRIPHENAFGITQGEWQEINGGVVKRLGVAHSDYIETTISVKLLDQSGQTKRQNKFKHHRKDDTSKAVKFDVSSLPKGMYYLHVEGGGKIQKKQIMIN